MKSETEDRNILPSDEITSLEFTMDTIKKVVIKKEDYPCTRHRIVPLQPGDEFYISYKGIRYKPGDKDLDYPAIVERVIYKPRPWYLFWKQKEIYGYYLRWIGN